MTERSQPYTWRLIDSGPACCALNMSIDEALLASFTPPDSPPVFRLYAWDPPALSIGRFQKAAEEIDFDCCRRDALPFVRRITGGGALFHEDELTYSIVCSPAHIPEASSVKDSFCVLTAFLLAFYRRLGLDASFARDAVSDSGRLGVRTPFCYAGRETFDIVVNNRKIGGNAQRRLKNTIFQHGSIPIVNRAHTGLQYMKDRSPEHAEGTASLMDLGVVADLETLKRLLTESFVSCLGPSVRLDDLSPGEQSLAEKLQSDTYSSELWNLHGERQ